jgi:hypothetical protein
MGDTPLHGPTGAQPVAHLELDSHRHGEHWSAAKPTPPSGLTDRALERFLEALATQFNSERDAKDRSHIDAAYRIPLSEIETELTIINAPDNDGVCPSYQNVVHTLETVMKPERAYRIWQALDLWLKSGDRDALIQWARTEAARRRIPWSSSDTPPRTT